MFSIVIYSLQPLFQDDFVAEQQNYRQPSSFSLQRSDGWMKFRPHRVSAPDHPNPVSAGVNTGIVLKIVCHCVYTFKYFRCFLFPLVVFQNNHSVLTKVLLLKIWILLRITPLRIALYNYKDFNYQSGRSISGKKSLLKIKVHLIGIYVSDLIFF